MPSGTGIGTESYTWDSETEFGYGTFTDTTTDGGGSVILSDLPSPRDFDYDILSQYLNDSSTVEIRDASTGTVLESRTVSDSSQEQGTMTINIADHPELEFYAEASDNDGDAEITDAVDGTQLVFVQNNSSYTAQKEYRYTTSGTYETELWDFTNTTTATKLSYDCSIPSGYSITFEIRDETGATLTTIPASDGVGSELFDVSPSDTYRVYASLEAPTNTYDATPSLNSVTLESHTSTGDTLQVDSVNGVDVDLSWGGVFVADGYQILRAEASGVDPGDYTPLGTTTNTTFTDSTGDAGTEYYYRVRAQYEGE